MVTIALAKGRLAESIIKMLQKFDNFDIDFNSRKLVFKTDDNKYRFFMCKPSDVPTFVDYGIADIGVVGKDTIDEEQRDIVKLLDLGFGKCKMCVCGYIKDKDKLNDEALFRVATKYPHTALMYFESRGKNVEIIKLNGSVELGPVVGLSDFIVDIVETGKTLKENGLEVLEIIDDICAILIANPSKFKTNFKEINAITQKLRG